MIIRNIAFCTRRYAQWCALQVEESRDYNRITEDTCSVLLTKYYSNDQIKTDGMGGACGTDGGAEKCIQDFGGVA
jgi:hypothetical protein